MESLVKKDESVTESCSESRRSSWSRSSSETASCSSSDGARAKGSFDNMPKREKVEKESVCEEKATDFVDSKFEKPSGRKDSEIDMMKERFAKLLLGEDMSGSGKGVCTASAISNAITNLCATIFGQLWRLEPLSTEKKTMWRREMEYLLCVSDHIVELIPTCQTFPDGSKMEVMTCRPRADIFINLPALRKLDNMLLEILDSFIETEFWYVDQGIVAPEADGSASFRKAIQRQEEKWWLPVPRVPPGGLSENSRRQLQHTRECTSQILKAAMAINSATLAEMEVPNSYMEALPKNGKACLGDLIYRYITSDHFSAECLLDCIDLSSEHVALEIANRVEASIYVWRRRNYAKPPTHSSRSSTKSSWEMVKDLMIDGDKREFLAERAEGLLLCLKQRFPNLSQTTLDTTKIQCNKDVGKSILESYSRVLESLAFNIVSRIDDLLYVDELNKTSDKLSPLRTINVVAQKRMSMPYSMPATRTPYRTASTTPSFSPLPLVSPARADKTPFLGNNDRPNRRGFGVKRVLTNYLGADSKSKVCGNSMEAEPCLISSRHGNETFVQYRDSPKQQNGSKTRQIDH